MCALSQKLDESALSDSTVTDSGKREKVGDTENSELVSRGNEFVKYTKRFCRVKETTSFDRSEWDS